MKRIITTYDSELGATGFSELIERLISLNGNGKDLINREITG